MEKDDGSHQEDSARAAADPGRREGCARVQRRHPCRRDVLGGRSKEAAYADSIVVDELQQAVERLAAATTFEGQQDAIVDAVAAAHETIDAVSDGTVTRLEKSLRPLPILLRQIREQAASTLDVFRPDLTKIENIRKATSQVVPIVQAEMRANERGDDAQAVILHLEHSTRLLGSRNYQVREAAANAVVECIDRLAA